MVSSASSRLVSPKRYSPIETVSTTAMCEGSSTRKKVTLWAPYQTAITRRSSLKLTYWASSSASLNGIAISAFG